MQWPVARSLSLGMLTVVYKVIGAAMEANDNTLETGRHILLTGLVLQTASYLFFTLLITYSHWRIAKDKMLDSSDFPWVLIYVIYVSSVAILVTLTSISLQSKTFINLLLASWRISYSNFRRRQGWLFEYH